MCYQMRKGVDAQIMNQRTWIIAQLGVCYLLLIGASTFSEPNRTKPHYFPSRIFFTEPNFFYFFSAVRYSSVREKVYAPTVGVYWYWEFLKSFTSVWYQRTYVTKNTEITTNHLNNSSGNLSHNEADFRSSSFLPSGQIDKVHLQNNPLEKRNSFDKYFIRFW